MPADLAALKDLARLALAAGAHRVVGAVERRRAAVLALCAARPNLAAPVALRLVKQVEAEAAVPLLPA